MKSIGNTRGTENLVQNLKDFLEFLYKNSFTTMTDFEGEEFLKRELNTEELNLRKADILTKIQFLEERINEGSVISKAERLVSLLRWSQGVERQESEVLSHYIIEHAKLQAEVNQFEVLPDSTTDECLYDILQRSLYDSNEKMNLMKKDLGSKIKSILSLKRQIDDVPIPAELSQYELRFSELYTNIQRKLRQTRKFYQTYNALLEIKEVMLKETSLLNSISSQFQDAITTPTGRSKLIDSMEGILQGIQLKLEKIQVSQESEEKVCDDVKEKYRQSLAEQRHCYSLLKAFQEECTRNERSAWGKSVSRRKAHFELWVIGRAALSDQGPGHKGPGARTELKCILIMSQTKPT